MGALHDAVFASSAEAIRAALERGAAIEERDELDRTALALAAACGHQAPAIALIDAGADLEAAESRRGERPLHAAAAEGKVDMARLLVRRGAALEGRDRRGGTPLLVATIAAQADVIRALVELGADPSPRDVNGDSPLHCLARSAKSWTGSVTMFSIVDGEKIPIANPQYGRHLDNVRLLIELGADPKAKNAAGRTPRDLAVAADDETIAAILGSPARRPRKKPPARKAVEGKPARRATPARPAKKPAAGPRATRKPAAKPPTRKPR